MIPWLRLGLRLSLGSGRAGLGRMALMASGAAVGMVLVLAALAVPDVIGAQVDRLTARTPTSAEDGGAGGLRMVEIEDAIDGRRLARVAVSGGETTQLRPPGVQRLPAAGEIVVSPSLAALIEVDPRAANRFPQRRIGTVGPAGLVAPDELRAYVGVTREQIGTEPQPVRGFGASAPVLTGGGSAGQAAPAAWEGTFTVERVMAVVFALFLLVPLGVFLATCARLSAASRDRRLAALRLLGATAHQAQRVNAAENGIVAIGGAGVGAVLFLLLRGASDRWHIGRFHWYVADIPASPWRLALVGAALSGFAMMVGALASAPGIRTPLATRRDAPSRRVSRWRVAPLALAALLLAAVSTPLGGFRLRGTMLVGGVLLCTIGLAAALPVASAAAGRLIAYARRPAWLRLAGRRLEHVPAASPRLASAIVVGIFLSGVGLAGAASYAAWTRPSAERGVPVLSYVLPAANADLVSLLRDSPGVTGVASAKVVKASTVDGGDRVRLMIGDCGDLRAMFTGADACVEGGAYRILVAGDAGDPVPAGPGALAVEIAGVTAAVPLPTETLRLTPSTALYQSASVFVSRTHPALADVPAPKPDQITVFVPSDSASVEAFYQLVAVHAPAVAVQGYRYVESSFDPVAALTLVYVGLACTVLLAGAAFAAAAADRAIERRRETARLMVVGAPRHVLIGAEMTFVAVPLVLGTVAAVVAAGAAIWSSSHLLDTDVVVLAERGLPILWAAAVLLVAVLVVIPVVGARRFTVEQLRRE